MLCSHLKRQGRIIVKSPDLRQQKADECAIFKVRSLSFSVELFFVLFCFFLQMLSNT